MLDVSTPATAANGKSAAEPDPRETDEWIEALDGVISAEGPQRAREIIEALTVRARTRGADIPITLTTPYVNTIPVARATAVSRRPATRRTAAPLRALERDGDGRAREQALRRPGRSRRDVLVVRNADRRRLQPLLACAVGRTRRRPRVLPRPRIARRVRARLPRRAAHRRATRFVPARSRRQGTSVRIRIRG